ncbi:MAG: glycerophosphoryl diester phosphodiesterase [Alphaproteobacteria bacterium]|nr:glycerophosphoryl diester phosphodiesterase [Alphaproteobacteria bacterium]
MTAGLKRDLPPVIGHRGAAAHAPENTLAGFRAARALGCTWVEFDVRLTGDGTLVVCHDDALGRTTDGTGRISRLPVDAIRRCDAGSKFAPLFAGEQVPTLAQALTLCGELGLEANVEIKAERGRAAATVAAVAAYVGGAGKNSGPPMLISSFLPDAAAAAAMLLPEVPRGMLWRKLPRGWRRIAAALGCTTIHLGHTELNSATVAQVTEAGYPLLAYTVNDPARARQLFGWGVASVFSDAPDIILAALANDAVGARGAGL